MSAPPPFDLFRRLARPGEGAIFFDGFTEATPTPLEQELRQWSFLCARPSQALCVREGRAWVRARDGPWREVDGDPWELARGMRHADAPPVPGVPFPHGVAGLIGYDAGRLIERVPDEALDDTMLPQILLFRFDAVVAVPREGAPRVLARSEADARELRARLHEAPPVPREGSIGGVVARTSPKEFEAMVARGKHHVRIGDVFQVNLSHRLEADCTLDPRELYARLRTANPAPFSAFFDSGELPWDARGFHVLSSSPERLFRLEAGRLEARPIAGTRRRARDPEKDEALKQELLADPKERAEHVMLVDLARNDLGRVSEHGSVRVPRLLSVESYRTVHHLVSVVEGQLARGHDAVDALRALFPGGTITGAPKVRAMELIEQIEPLRRGVYTGSLGWISDAGECDFNILIRTLLLRHERVHLQVGAGIVEDSVPEREYHETMAKAKGLLMALGAEEE